MTSLGLRWHRSRHAGYVPVSLSMESIPVRPVRPRRLLLALPLIVACAESPAGPPVALTELPRALTSAESGVAGASNAFAFDLFREAAAASTRNAFVSPLSVSMALGMLLNGADGATLEAMRSTLHLGPSSGLGSPSLTEVNAGYRGLIDLLRGLDATTLLRVANSVWYRAGFTAAPDFLTATRASFDAEVRAVDFAAPATLGTINGWVRDATAGRIPSILDAIRPDDVMYLINAIHFKGRWRTAFDPSQTQLAAFQAATGGVQQVPMMHRQDRYRLLETPAFAAVDLPYGNGAFTMTVLLPHEDIDIGLVVDSLTDARWTAMMTALATAPEMTADLYLPRFTLELTRTLNADLTTLGMGVAFDPERADLTRLGTGFGRLFVSVVTHKTFVDVNEAGTEAAAVTGIGVGVVSAPPTFRVDRPFVFAIRERFSGAVLFLGKIVRLP